MRFSVRTYAPYTLETAGSISAIIGLAVPAFIALVVSFAIWSSFGCACHGGAFSHFT